MSESNAVNAAQETVVESPQVEGVSAPDKANDGASAVAEQKPKQTAAENSEFAKIRKRAEAAEKELAAAKALSERMGNLIAQQYGYTGSGVDIADQLEAAATGKDIADIVSAREAEIARTEEVERLKAELERYRPLAVQSYMGEVLAKVKAAFPDCTATSVEEFGIDFARMINDGYEPAFAYGAYLESQKAGKKPVPAEIGTVATGEAEPSYYTASQVRKMDSATRKKNHEKIMESMKRPTWGN